MYEINNMAVCVTNPCPPNSFPHFKTWNGKMIEIGDDLKCHAVSEDEDINQCEFVDVDRDEELFCSTLGIVFSHQIFIFYNNFQFKVLQ